MAIIQIFAAQSTSAAPHIHFSKADYVGGEPASVSAGLSAENTFFFAPGDDVRNVKIGVYGVFGSASASSNLVVGISHNSGNTFLELFSVSAPMLTTLSMHHGEILRFRLHTAITTTNTSVDLFLS